MGECLINMHSKFHELGFRCLSTLWYPPEQRETQWKWVLLLFQNILFILFQTELEKEVHFAKKEKKNLLKAKNTSHVWVQGTYVLLLLSGLRWFSSIDGRFIALVSFNRPRDCYRCYISNSYRVVFTNKGSLSFLTFEPWPELLETWLLISVSYHIETYRFPYFLTNG